MNSLASGLMQDDLAAVMPAAPAGIVLPKPDSVEDVWQLDRALGGIERDARSGRGRPATAILAIATETAVAVTALPGYVKSPERLLALTWGGEDLAAELGAVANRDAAGEFTFTYRVVRSLCQIAAAAAGKPAIETLFADFRDEAGLASGRRARRGGRLQRHARHPPGPGAGDQRGLHAGPRPRLTYRAPRRGGLRGAPGAGVTQLDGRMLDRPHLSQARRVLERAASLGILDRPH